MKHNLTRLEIEQAWIDQSYFMGALLCRFTIGTKLRRGWFKVWYREHGFISDKFSDVHFLDKEVLSYLTRALSLNMLLDDNEVE